MQKISYMEPLVVLDVDFITKLKSLDLFVNCGKEIYDITYNFPFKQLSDISEVNNSIVSSDWENFTLEARNTLTIYLGRNRVKDREKWNQITRIYKNELKQFEPRVDKFILDSKVDNTEQSDFDWIFLSMCMENHYLKLDKNIPLFFLKLLPIYSKGHIPCGWQGVIKENTDGKAVNLSQGVLLIY